jgi:hypothetical protein
VSALIVVDGDPSKVNVNGYAKGDLLAANSGGTLQALHVGTNTNVLTADSVQTQSLKYAPGGSSSLPVPFVLPPVNLTDAATIATDASLGNNFRITLLASGHILGAPTNPTDEQMCMWEIKQGGTGNNLLTLAGGAGGFLFGTDLTSITLSTGVGVTDLLGCRYNAAASRWWVIAFMRGF